MLNDEKFQNNSEKWTIQADGSSVHKRGGVGVVINTSKGKVLKYGVQLQFPTTNNEAKYETILTRLGIGKALKAGNILLKNDSKLVIGQIKGEYEAKEGRMQKYLRLTNHIIQEFDRVDFTKSPEAKTQKQTKWQGKHR